MENEFQYFQFPLFLLRDLFTDKKKTLNQILKYGLFNYSKSFEYDETEVAKQVVWGFYRGGLPAILKKKLDDYIKKEVISLDEECSCFDINGFNPDGEIYEILEIFKIDKEFQLHAFEYYKINKSYRHFKIDGNMEACLLAAKQIEKLIPEKEPFVMINSDHVFDFRNNEKTVLEIAQLAMFISMRSILGRKKYCKTNKKLITCRMFGFRNIKDVDSTMDTANREYFDMFNNRYHFDKIKTLLELTWFIVTYSNHTRGLYIAVGKNMTHRELAFAAEKSKKKNLIIALQATKKDAKNQAVQQTHLLEKTSKALSRPNDRY